MIDLKSLDHFNVGHLPDPFILLHLDPISAPPRNDLLSIVDCTHDDDSGRRQRCNVSCNLALHVKV